MNTESVIKRKTAMGLLLAALCLLLILPAAAAETREGVIALEGMEERVEETLFKSPQGFSFWYASERLEAESGTADNIEGVIVSNPYSDDYMILSMIPEEDAEEYTEDDDASIVERSLEGRVQTDLYRDLEDGQYYFLTLIAENGQYLRAVGQYSLEAAEGTARFFQRVLDSVAFEPGCLFRAEWGEWASDEEPGLAQVILTALKPAENVKLLSLSWDCDDGFTASWEEQTALGSFDAQQSASVTLEFIGDLPNNGILYTDEEGSTRAFALDISGENGDLYFWDIEE